MCNRWFIGLLGLTTYAFLLGCGAESADTGVQSGAANTPLDDADEHDHSAEGPHGGHVIVLGEEEYHAELTHDEATHTVAVYLLDATAKQPVSSEQESITLQAFKDGDFIDYAIKATGDDGAFSLVDEQLCDLLLHAETFKARLHATIAGKEYVGSIEHAAHDHEGHDHADEAHADDTHDHDTEHAEDDGHEHDAEHAEDDGHDHDTEHAEDHDH